MVSFIGLFIAGVILLLISTDYFMKSATRLSVALRLSPLIIGLTVVSIGTSLPELVVSIIAAAEGDMGLATGNIIGSNITNVLLVFAVGILAGKIRVGTIKTQRNIYIVSVLTGLYLLLYAFSVSHIVSGLILLACTIIVSYYEYSLGVQGRQYEDQTPYHVSPKTKFAPKDIWIVLGTLLGIVIGGMLTVTSVEGLSLILGLSTTVLGLSITAIATSLPELMTTIFSQRNHEEKLTIGNLIGSNIYNISLIGGMILVLSPWYRITPYEYLTLISVTALFAIIIVLYRGKEIPTYVGVVLLGLFSVYIYYLR